MCHHTWGIALQIFTNWHIYDGFVFLLSIFHCIPPAWIGQAKRNKESSIHLLSSGGPNIAYCILGGLELTWNFRIRIYLQWKTRAWCETPRTSFFHPKNSKPIKFCMAPIKWWYLRMMQMQLHMFSQFQDCFIFRWATRGSRLARSSANSGISSSGMSLSALTKSCDPMGLKDFVKTPGYT